MAIGSSNIQMGGTGTNSIIQEKSGTTSGTPTAHQNVSLYGLSVDGVNDYQSPGGAYIDITGSPNQVAPYKMSEFSGYSQAVPFSWGTPGAVSPTTYLGNQDQENRNGNDTASVSTVEMILTALASAGSISFRVRNTDDGGGYGGTVASSYASLAYTGALTSLEARWVHTGLTYNHSGNLADTGEAYEIFWNNGMIDNDNINNQTVSGVTASSSLTGTGSFSGGFSTLRTTSGSMSAALAVASDSVGSPSGYSVAQARWLSGSLKLQLRANGTDIVDLVSETGTFDLKAETSEEGSS